MHFKYSNYSHYFLGQHNVIKVLQLQASRVTTATGNSVARDLFVYTRAVAKQAM